MRPNKVETADQCSVCRTECVPVFLVNVIHIYSYIYIYIYIYVCVCVCVCDKYVSYRRQVRRVRSSWLTFTIRPCYSSLLASPLDCIQCPHRAYVSKSLLDGQHWIEVYMHLRKFVLGSVADFSNIIARIPASAERSPCVTFRPLVKQTTTRNLYITIYIYFLDGRLCEVGAVRRGIKIVRRWGLNFSMSGDEGRDNTHCVTTREVSWTAGSFFLYLLLFNSSALYYVQTPTQR